MTKDGSRITLRQLEIFLAAVENRSFAAAAETLSLSAPAVSMQMSKLGEELGAVLFEKEGRSIQPTEIANALVPYARQMTTTLTDAVEMVKSMQGELDNRVRVAMVSTARNFGPQLFQEFQKHHPRIDLQITIANRRGVIEALETGQIDLALMGRPPRRIEVTAHQFARHPYVLISHPDHPLARFRRIRRADLAAHRFLVREPGSGTRMVHEHYFQSDGLSLPQSQEMDSNANIKQAVMANMGLAFISAHTIALEHEAGKLTILDAEDMPELRDWFVLYPKEAVLGAAARQFRDFIKSKGPRFMRDFFGPTLAPV
ncbi:LysR family transcriptional regulator [Roseovarius sp.]|uniref:LysR family transcriptional regulator n=1 Tax=Roseovarius sp. TaxID=1486281 RepID=UPI00262C56C0|nr:LysR family transcriptional regulator [Roseovarius sp.]MDM8164612.1 LysR family transcriptional regulator [Roseovarius sp.]